MPEICRFYGIIIRMYLIDREHPPRHIHLKYGEYEAVMELINFNIIDAPFPKNADNWFASGLNCIRTSSSKCGIGKTSAPLHLWSKP